MNFGSRWLLMINDNFAILYADSGLLLALSNQRSAFSFQQGQTHERRLTIPKERITHSLPILMLQLIAEN